MNAAGYFRYAWIAPEALAALMPTEEKFDALTQHLEQGPALAAAVPDTALRAVAVQRMVAFARHPCLAAFLTRRALLSTAYWSAKHAEKEALELANWCLALGLLLRQCSAAKDSVDFLQNLAATDFPVLLAWSNADLARRLFVVRDDVVLVAPGILAAPKAHRRAVQTCLRYAFGALGRFGPRDGWIGVGFATMDGPGTATVIDRTAERIVPEPNIKWMARHWFDDQRDVVQAGESSWEHLRRRLRAHASHRQGALQTALDRVYARAMALGDACWSFSDVDNFLRETAGVLQETVGRERWQTEPHRWWATRVVTHEIRISQDFPARARLLYEIARERWLRAGLAEPDIRVDRPRIPFPMRVAQSNRAAVVARADELTDWVLDANALQPGMVPALPEVVPCTCAVVIQLDATGGRYRLHEPNPRRTAQSIGRFFESPAYLDTDRDALAIAPPEDAIDQRMLRPSHVEWPLDAIPWSIEAMYRAPVQGTGTANLLTREFASSRYANAPDLVPIMYNPRSSYDVGYGTLDLVGQLWYLKCDEARALATAFKMASTLATYYRVEIHSRLGAPRWLSLLVGGKLSRMPTTSVVAFEYLLHACRVADGPIVVHAPRSSETEAVLCDSKQRILAVEIYTAVVEDHRLDQNDQSV